MALRPISSKRKPHAFSHSIKTLYMEVTSQVNTFKININRFIREQFHTGIIVFIKWELFGNLFGAGSVIRTHGLGFILTRYAQWATMRSRLNKWTTATLPAVEREKPKMFPLSANTQSSLRLKQSPVVGSQGVSWTKLVADTQANAWFFCPQNTERGQLFFIFLGCFIHK